LDRLTRVRPLDPESEDEEADGVKRHDATNVDKARRYVGDAFNSLTPKQRYVLQLFRGGFTPAYSTGIATRRARLPRLWVSRKMVMLAKLPREHGEWFREMARTNDRSVSAELKRAGSIYAHVLEAKTPVVPDCRKSPGT
jgi:hypothetical protein